jgi:hypothetical protein
LNLRRRCGFVAHDRPSQALANDPYEEKSYRARMAPVGGWTSTTMAMQ